MFAIAREGPSCPDDLRPYAPRRRPKTHAELDHGCECHGRLAFVRTRRFRIVGREPIPWARQYRCVRCKLRLLLSLWTNALVQDTPPQEGTAAGTGRRRHGHAGRRGGRRVRP
jgi:hypothetical protein